MNMISRITVLVLVYFIIFTNFSFGTNHKNSNNIQDSYSWTDEGEFKSLKIEKDGISSIRFSNDGTQIFVVNKDSKGYKIFDSETGNLIKEKKFDGSGVVFAKISNDDSAFVISMFNENKEIISHQVYSISSDSLILESILKGNLYHCWDWQEDLDPISRPTQSYYSKKDNTLWASFTYTSYCAGTASSSVSSGRFIKATNDGDFTITTVINKTPILDYILTDDNRFIYIGYNFDVTFTSENSTQSQSNTLKVINLETGEGKILNDTSAYQGVDDTPIGNLIFMQDIVAIKERNAFLVVFEDGRFRIWDLDDYSTLDSFYIPKSYSYAIYPSGKNIISLSGHNINIYSIPNFRRIDSIVFPNEVDIRGTLAVAPNGESFVHGALDGTIRLFYRDVITSIEDNQAFAGANDISIYPNPASDFINISVENEAVLLTREVQILDLLGLVVSKTELTDGNNRIDISNLARGTYFIKVGDKIEKFVKM